MQSRESIKTYISEMELVLQSHEQKTASLGNFLVQSIAVIKDTHKEGFFNSSDFLGNYVCVCANCTDIFCVYIYIYIVLRFLYV